MYWIGFAVAAYVAAALQAGVAPWIAIQGHEPDFLLILAAYYALTAPAEQAAISCWILGLAADVVDYTLGARALGYGLMGMAVLRVRGMIFRDQIVPHAVIVTLGCFAIRVFAQTVEMVKMDQIHLSLFVGLVLGSALSAVYSAVLTLLPLHWILKWTGPLLGIRPSRVR